MKDTSAGLEAGTNWNLWEARGAAGWAAAARIEEMDRKGRSWLWLLGLLGSRQQPTQGARTQDREAEAS